MTYQEKRKKKIQVLFEDEEREGSISATDLFAEIDDFDDIITDDSDNRVRFPPFSQEAMNCFPCKLHQKLFEDVYN